MSIALQQEVMKLKKALDELYDKVIRIDAEKVNIEKRLTDLENKKGPGRPRAN